MSRKLRVTLLAASLFLGSLSRTDAQSPGGVTPAAWYRADAAGIYSDAGVTNATDNATVYLWNSEVGDFPLRQSSSSLRPVYSTSNHANFNPTISFDGSNDVLEFTAGTGINIINRADGTILTAGYMNKQKRSGFAGFHASMDYPGLHVFSNYKLLFFTANGPQYQGVSDDLFQPNTYFTAGSAWRNAQGGTPAYLAATVSFNGKRNQYIGNNIYNVQADNNNARNFRIGADSNWGAFSGQLNEVLVYEDPLTEEELDRVESYLAIKYGSTFASGQKNYLNSSGSVIWDASANTGFHFNIAGIARDGVLYQKQSWSTNSGDQVLIGVGGLASSNAANSGSNKRAVSSVGRQWTC